MTHTEKKQLPLRPKLTELVRQEEGNRSGKGAKKKKGERGGKEISRSAVLKA